MIYPIVAYGDPVLKKEAEEVPEGYSDLKKLVDDMFETMHNASGVGLAAPQIGKSLRLFVIDLSPFAEDPELEKEEREQLEGLQKAFINPEMVEETGKKWAFSEGCLSIPNINEDIFREPEIVINYLDTDFNEHEERFTSLAARVIQHEFDHIEGVLFTDKISSFKKRLINNKLKHISQGKVKVDYRMRFPKIKKGR
jgi:peptide deformylase